MEKFPNVTQKIILRYQEKILIARHANGVHDFPGGRIEWGENLFDSLRRELKEELDFNLEDQPRLFHVWNYVSKDQERHSVMVYYICDLKEEPDFNSPENLELLWLENDQMKEIVRDHDFVDRMFRWNDKETPHSLFYCD